MEGTAWPIQRGPPILVRLGSKKQVLCSEGGGVQQRGVQRGGGGLERLSRGGAAQRRGSLCYLLYFVSLRKSFQAPQGKVFFSFCFLELSHMFNLGARRIRFYRRKTKLGFILKAKLGFILKTKLGFISKAKTIMGSEIEPTPKLPQFESYLYHFLAIGFGGMLVNPSEPQSPPLQNGFIGRLEEIDIEH